MNNNKNTYNLLVDMGQLGMDTLKSGDYETKEELAKITLIIETIHDLATLFKNKIS